MIRPVCTNCGAVKDEHSYKILRCPLPDFQWHPTNFYSAAGLPPTPPGWVCASFKRSMTSSIRYRHKRTRTVVYFSYQQFEAQRDPKTFLEAELLIALTLQRHAFNSRQQYL